MGNLERWEKMEGKAKGRFETRAVSRDFLHRASGGEYRMTSVQDDLQILWVSSSEQRGERSSRFETFFSLVFSTIKQGGSPLSTPGSSRTWARRAGRYQSDPASLQRKEEMGVQHLERRQCSLVVAHLHAPQKNSLNP